MAKSRGLLHAPSFAKLSLDESHLAPRASGNPGMRPVALVYPASCLMKGIEARPRRNAAVMTAWSSSSIKTVEKAPRGPLTPSFSCQLSRGPLVHPLYMVGIRPRPIVHKFRAVLFPFPEYGAHI